MKTTDLRAWVRRWLAEAEVGARLAPFVCVDCRDARRSPGGQDAQNLVPGYCSLLCWQASEARLLCFRTEGPNGGSKSMESWSVARNGSGFVAMDGRWKGCVKAAVGCTSHSL
jgi:hypothetical protein